MKKLITALSLMCLSGLSCQKDKKSDNNDIMVIKTGSVCGWCAGSDSVTITRNGLVYDYSHSCDKNYQEKKQSFTDPEWNELLTTLDFNKFEGITLNSCYVCADGCDSWVYVKSGSASHEIRYGYNDSLQLNSVKAFITKLDEIKSRFK